MKINASKIAARLVVLSCYAVATVLMLGITILALNAIISIPSIHSMLNNPGGMCLGFMIALAVAAIGVTCAMVIKDKFIDFILNRMEKSMKEKRA